MIHVVGSISWNSNEWNVDLPTEGDEATSRFRNVTESYFGNESWNLDPSKFVWAGYEYGF